MFKAPACEALQTKLRFKSFFSLVSVCARTGGVGDGWDRRGRFGGKQGHFHYL